MMSTQRIVTRAEWGARSPKRRYTIKPTPRLWLHHFATDGWKGVIGMRKCQNFHMDDKGWSDIAYSFCVDNDTGVIYEGRGALVAGGHTADDNSSSHAICIMGNTHASELSQKAIDSIAWLVKHGFERGWWLTPKITGSHRDAQAWGYSRKNGTACAGDFAQRRLPEINRLATEAPQTPEKDIVVLDTHEARVAYVKNAYEKIVGRTPSEDEVGYWVWVIAIDLSNALNLIVDLTAELRSSV